MRKQLLFLFVVCFMSQFIEAQNQVLPTKIKADSTHYFIENKGQWPDEVLFLARIGGFDTWITKDGVVYDFYKLTPIESDQKNSGHDITKYQQDEYRKEGHVLKTTYSGCNSTSAKGLGQSVCKPYYNYFIGNDSSKWASHVQLFQSAVVKDIYPNIDIHYYFSEGSIRHDFIINPGADPSNIQMVIKGSNYININENNELVYQTSIGEVKSAKVFAFQNIDGQKTQVECRFIKTQNGYGFQIGEYNRNEELIIDPLIWSTFIGGSGYDEGFDIVLDSANNVFVSGTTMASNFPSTVGSYDEVFNGDKDAFISKLSSDGSTLIFSTYLGGLGQDFCYSMCNCFDGGIAICGYTSSAGFPTTSNALDQSFNGVNDIFIAKMNSAGDDLGFSTFYGGSDTEIAYKITCDTEGNIYFTGISSSVDFPTSLGAFQTVKNGGADVIVAKVNILTSNIVYSTFIGGTDYDIGYSLDVDDSGNCIVTGQTASTNFPLSANCYDGTLNGSYDVFVTYLNSLGASIVYSTLIGGSDIETVSGIKLINSRFYLGGSVTSNNFPTTAGCFDDTYNGGTYDFYLLCYDMYSLSMIYSTYFGGSGNDVCFDFDVDAVGNACAVGYSYSSNFPVTIDAYDASFNGSNDAVFLKLNNLGNSVLYSTFVGGNSAEYYDAFTFDLLNNFYFTGDIWGVDYPTTLGAFCTTQADGGTAADACITKLGVCSTLPFIQAIKDTMICSGENFILGENGGGSVFWIWTGPNGFSSSLQNPSLSSAMPINAGMYYVYGYDASGCSSLDSVFVDIQPSPTVSILGSSEICYGDSITIAGDGADNYIWNTTETTPSIFIFPTTTTTYSVTGSNGICTGTASFTVTVLPSPNIVISGDSIICPGTSATLSATGGISYYWSTGQNSSSISVNPSTSSYYFVEVSDGTCTGSDTVFVDLYPEVMADAGTDTTISEGESVILTPSGGIVYEWSPDVYLSCTLCENPISTPQTSITYTVLITDTNGCSKTDSVVITVKGQNDCGEIFIPTAFTPNNDGNNDDFKVLGNCIATIHLAVYDRWGGLVFKTDDPIESWKGEKDGSQLNGGIYTYIYIGTLTDGTPISGDGKVNMIK